MRSSCSTYPEHQERNRERQREEHHRQRSGRVAELAERWSRKGYDLDFGVGIAQGHATLGSIGFEGRT